LQYLLRVRREGSVAAARALAIDYTNRDHLLQLEADVMAASAVAADVGRELSRHLAKGGVTHLGVKYHPNDGRKPFDVGTT